MRLSGRRLLLVEDDATLARMLERLFMLEDASISHAADGESALRTLAAEERFDLVIVDLLLPDISGWDVVDRAAARDRRAPRPAVIVLSASGDPEEPRRAQRRGVPYLRKPFAAPALIELAVDQLGASEADGG